MLSNRNPHKGTNLEAWWGQGFAAEFLVADRIISPPSSKRKNKEGELEPLTQEEQDAYREGREAGRLSINGMRARPTTPPAKFGTWDDLLVFAGEHGTEHVLLEIARHGVVKELGAEVASEFSLARGLYFLMSVAVFGPDRAIFDLDRSRPFFDRSAILALQQASQEVAEDGIFDSNVTFFLPACDLPAHTRIHDDEFLSQGFWHGRVSDSESANSEAAVHQSEAAVLQGELVHHHPGNTIIFQFEIASPGLVQVIDVEPFKFV